MEDRLCALVQLATCETVHGSLSKNAEESFWAYYPCSHIFLKMAFPDLWFFWLDSFFPLRSRCYYVIRKDPNIIHLNVQNKAAWDFLLWEECEGLAFYFHKGMNKGKGFYILGKGKLKNFGLRELEEFSSPERFWTTMRNDPSWVVYGWCEWGGFLGPLLSPWRHLSCNPGLLVPAFAAISAGDSWGFEGPFQNYKLASEIPASIDWIVFFSRKLVVVTTAVGTQASL